MVAVIIQTAFNHPVYRRGEVQQSVEIVSSEHYWNGASRFQNLQNQASHSIHNFISAKVTLKLL